VVSRGQIFLLDPLIPRILEPCFYIIMRNPLVTLIYNVLGYLFLCIIIVCLFALGKFLYLPPPKHAVTRENVSLRKFTKKLRKEIGSGQFHLSDKPITTDIETAPLCLRCHGNFCHNKSEEFRSYYNMHTFYIACETCHIRNESGNNLQFKWFDDKSGKELASVSGQYQNYGAKIVPVKPGGWSVERLDKFPEEKLALEFLQKKDSYTPEQKETIKKQLMKHVSKKPVICEECHSEQRYLNYRELGYTAERSADLSRIEIVKLIREYKDFKFPVIFSSEKK